MTERTKEPGVMLAPDSDPDLDALEYPIAASMKLDGIRGIIVGGEFLTRKHNLFSKPLTRMFKPIIEKAGEDGRVLDFEIWSPKLKYNQIQKAVAHPLPSHGLRLYVFDMVDDMEWYRSESIKDEDNADLFTPFYERLVRYSFWCRGVDPEKKMVVPVKQYRLGSADEVRELFWGSLKNGYEGLMLKGMRTFYKHGRTTEKENTFWKMKDWQSAEGIILGYKQATRQTKAAAANVVRDRQGYIKRTHKKDTRETIEAVGSVLVKMVRDVIIIYGGETICHFPKGTEVFCDWGEEAYDLSQRITWAKRERYIGRHVEFKYQPHGSKNKPRLPHIMRLRPDLD